MTEQADVDPHADLDARLAELARSFDAPPANDLAARAKSHADHSRAARLVAAAAIIAVVIGVSSVVLRSGEADHTEVFSGPPPATEPLPAAPASTNVVPPTNELGEAAIAGGRSGELEWMIVRTPGDPSTGTCWRLDRPAVTPENPVRCAAGRSPWPLGVEVEHYAEHALVWGPITADVAAVRLRVGDDAHREATVVEAVDGTQRFFVAASPNGVTIHAVEALASDGRVLASVPVGSAPCPCPTPPGVDEASTTGDALLRPRPDSTTQSIPMNCPDRDNSLCIPARADQTLLLHQSDLVDLAPAERERVRAERIELIQSYWRTERFPTASDDAGNPTAWATLDELADR